MYGFRRSGVVFYFYGAFDLIGAIKYKTPSTFVVCQRAAWTFCVTSDFEFQGKSKQYRIGFLLKKNDNLSLPVCAAIHENMYEYVISAGQLNNDQYISNVWKVGTKHITHNTWSGQGQR